ncbi:MAG: transglutaminase-like domain-containing protein [Pirellula sp.]|nr:transglutaminase-like domain-containing protein [Pirellula sp.]
MHYKKPAWLLRLIVIGSLLLGPALLVGPGYSQDDSREETSPPEKASKSKANQKVDIFEVTGRVVKGANGPKYFAPQKMVMKFGLRISANGNHCSNLMATLPFPMDWPEQKLKVLNHEVPNSAVSDFRDLPAGARQLLLQMNTLGPSDVANLLVEVEVEKSFIDPPPDTSIFKIPKSLSKELKFYMGNSPYIDCDIPMIKKTAKSIAASSPENAWAQVEQLYDWVRDNIEYTNGDMKHIREALKDKKGDCEEMTSIFIALCRASGIPARAVWVPDHCYPEFYLEDQDGVGYWFPCQAAGDRQFGQMHEYRPILQKGDRFKVPEESGQQRYVASFFTCKQRPMIPGAGNPLVEEVLDLGPLQAQLDAVRQQSGNGLLPPVESGNTQSDK